MVRLSKCCAEKLTVAMLQLATLGFFFSGADSNASGEGGAGGGTGRLRVNSGSPTKSVAEMREHL
jgi:hypothetical protein